MILFPETGKAKMHVYHHDDTYILDTNAIIQNPEILARLKPTQIVFPAAVIKELQFRKDRGAKEQLFRTIQTLFDQGATKVEVSVEEPDLLSAAQSRHLAGADIAIISIAKDLYKQRDKRLHVVTSDQPLQQALKGMGISSASAADILDTLPTAAVDTETAKAVKIIGRADFR